MKPACAMEEYPIRRFRRLGGLVGRIGGAADGAFPILIGMLSGCRYDDCLLAAVICPGQSRARSVNRLPVLSAGRFGRLHGNPGGYSLRMTGVIRTGKRSCRPGIVLRPIPHRLAPHMLAQRRGASQRLAAVAAGGDEIGLAVVIGHRRINLRAVYIRGPRIAAGFAGEGGAAT